MTKKVEGAPKSAGVKTVVTASAAGTAFEWYDFFIYAPVAPILNRVFFSDLPETTGLIFTLLVFAVGFAFRPLGALIFGRIGDRIGRKATFLVTMGLMGGATFAIGFLPSYDQVGILAPVLLVIMRILQGLALGGEWGGAAIYIVEHVPQNKRGAASSWLGGSAAFGLAAALIVVLSTRTLLGEEVFQNQGGWRVPFFFSAVLLAISIWIRLKLHESPVFAKLKEEGRRSERPYAESFAHWPNLKLVLISLFGIMIAQGAVWYTVFFYGQTFMERVVKVAPATSNLVILVVTFASVPLYIAFGALSDRIGRKPVMLFGMVLTLVAMFPAFQALERFGNPALNAAQERSPVTIVADPADCSVQFDLIGKSQFTSACDIAKSTVANAGVSYVNAAGPAGSGAQVRIGETVVPVSAAQGADAAAQKASKAEISAALTAALAAAGYPAAAAPEQTNTVMLVLVLMVLVVGATALYGPQAAALVEMFPANVRYTALSLPYHIGTGWVGGFLPASAVAIVTTTGDIYAGLWYPFIFTLIAAVVMLVFFKDPKGALLD